MSGFIHRYRLFEMLNCTRMVKLIPAKNFLLVEKILEIVESFFLL